jgi:hypothetical protein
MKADNNYNRSMAEVDVESKSAKEEAKSIIIDGEVIEIDPTKEAAVRHKFDRYVLPVTFIFMILAVLDRNNVSRPRSIVNRSSNIHSLEMLECSDSTKTSALKVASLATSSPFPVS